MKELGYPLTPIGDEVDVAAGITFPDPYRWLEGDGEAVQQWQEAQNCLTSEYLKGCPQFAVLEDSVNQHFVDRIDILPRFVAGKWFRANQRNNSLAACVTVSAAPYGDPDEISIPVAANDEGTQFLSWIAPAPDGRIVAVGVCSDGSENNRIYLVDVESGAETSRAPPQLLMDAWTGGVCWLPDSSGFFFLALEGDPRNFRQATLFHDLKSGEQTPADIPLPDPWSADYTLVTLSRDGRYLVANHGMQTPKPVAIKDLSEHKPSWRPFVTQLTEMIAGFARGDRFIALTNHGASHGRVVAIQINSENPNDASRWSELVSESDMVLRSVSLVGDHLYVAGFVDTYSNVRVFDLTGRLVGELSLPGRGAIADPMFPLMTLIPRGHPDEYFFAFSTLIKSWGVYRHTPCGACTVETVLAPAVHIQNAIVEDYWAVSADGVHVPYHTVRLAGVEMPGSALIYAYGAFNLALVPEYPGAIGAFIAGGGIYVHGHIRGGAELGLDWWHSGRLKNKQNCFADLYAIAEDLIHRGVTTKGRLAMFGRSNGGLMAGVALAQRPDLWRAIVSLVPITDLIGALRDSYARPQVAREYADPTDPHEILRLSAFSPYHLVKDGIDYPAIFIDAGATDPRCPAWHARKLAARLQRASQNSRVLLRIRQNAGHGAATSKALRLKGYTEWLSFVMRQLNMKPKRPGIGGSR